MPLQCGGLNRIDCFNMGLSYSLKYDFNLPFCYHVCLIY